MTTDNKQPAASDLSVSSAGSDYPDTPCHECGEEMEGKESYEYVTECGDENWLCQKCHDEYQNSEN